MAEAVVALAVQRLTDLLIHEAAFLRDVDEEVRRLQAELKWMQCFLKDAELKQDQDERVRNWVAEVRDVAYDAEDIIDTFIIQIARKETRLCCSMLAKGPDLHQIGKQIESIRTKVADVSNAMKTYGVKFTGEGEGSSSSGEMQRRLRRSYPHVGEEVVSMEGCTSDLIAQLLIEEEGFRVVSIVGMGGLGKTTLAKRVYNHDDVKRHFDCYAWVFISQQCSTKDVLQEILVKISRDERDLYRRAKMEEEAEERLDRRDVYKRLREEEVVELLYNVLSEKRYFVVLDDIWRNEVWDCLKPAFPNGKKGSKVLFTTRNKEVALYADPWSSPIEPPFLTHEESWQLLCKKAFNDSCPPEFEKLGRNMVMKCGGLPLAIVILGGLLATKRSSYEWEVVERSINAHLSKFQQHYGGVYGILSLSYHELPFHLKPCFLYLGLFPEDWEIPKTKLVRLWIAEGFIPEAFKGEGEEKLEDVAEKFLEELINRCMVQVSRRDCIGRGVKTCRIHDLMRDLCVLKGREENFLGIIQQQANAGQDDPSVLQLATVKSRRIAIHPLIFQDHQQRYVPVVEGYPHLRSLVCFTRNYLESIMRKRQDISMYKEFRLLRVLDLECAIVFTSRIPKAIGNLIHLRYLGLKIAKSYNVPQSIANLLNLRTLQIWANGQITLPVVMSKLVNLRHLLLYRGQMGQCRMDTLRNLETLKYTCGENLIRGDAMVKLTNLRNLGITFRTSKEAEVVLQSPIVAAGCLRSLRIEMLPKYRLNSKSHSFSLNSEPFPGLESLSHCEHLAKLRIRGKIVDGCGHRNLEFLPVNLSKLVLHHTELHQDPMAMLEKLPNLRHLELGRDSYDGTNMFCSADGFPQLEVLKLETSLVKEWQVAEGAMSSLRSLYLRRLTRLRMIPEGLKFVTTLRDLIIHSMRKEFIRRLQVIEGVEGEDFFKVQHVPSIMVHNVF